MIVCDYVDSDDVRTFSKSDVTPFSILLIGFSKKGPDRRIPGLAERGQPRVPRFRPDHHDVVAGHQVQLILISNRQYIGRDDAVKSADFGHVPITWSSLDLARFERFDRSGQAREDMVIDFANDFCRSLPALKASRTGRGAGKLSVIVPGQQGRD